MSRVGKHLFTSESVSEGHPDKVCDQVADAVLDRCLEADKKSRVACEVLATTDLVVVSGEITTKATLNVEQIVRDVVKQIGYTNEKGGFDYRTLQLIERINQQSSDIAQGVDQQEGTQGAGDQGMMFGYACKETDVLMPAPITYSHKILQKAAKLRKNKEIAWLLPDAKAQVTLAYQGDNPVAIDTVVLSHQHTEDVSQKEIEERLKNEVIIPSLENTGLITKETKYFINPTGRFVIGGPAGDCGLTGRKIIVDTYGGMGRHGGGAFSGKDPSKVDRSAAYMARHVAKNLVHWGVCSRCEVQISYAIGVVDPISINVNTFGTGLLDNGKIEKLVVDNFDLRPAAIIEYLDLLKPIYQANMNYGHFGKKGVSWEQVLPKPASL
ncbi:MAG: methionine adenosyltransferase [Sphaerochaetaceae bacterium]|jgi:S-adenosylmethionine synthetase